MKNKQEKTNKNKNKKPCIKNEIGHYLYLFFFTFKQL
jgi:hypothetical protein